MPEHESDKTIFSLLEVTQSIQRTISDRYKTAFWVKAEMNKLNFYRQSGHCYPELVEKRDGKTIAQIKACLWREDYQRVNSGFRSVLNEPLKDGIKILFLAKLQFDPAHGLSLWILDIDPSFTLGDLEREKQDTIRKLREEGLYARNKSLSLPLLPQRIAIISVETSKGFADFTKVLETNPWGYRFNLVLFPSLLQGDNAVPSIRQQLKRIRKVSKHFDVVAIIRGGGGDVGLSCYNHFDLARDIASFPIPVITGIGHATNETVSEMISFMNAITPTKLAEFIIQTFHNFSVPVHEAEKKIINYASQLLRDCDHQFRSEVKLFRSVTENLLISNENSLQTLSRTLIQEARVAFKSERVKLSDAYHDVDRGANAMIQNDLAAISVTSRAFRKDLSIYLQRSKLVVDAVEKNVINMSPEKVLQRGYSITMVNGKSVKHASDIREGDILHTRLAEGEVVSTVKSINSNSDHE